MTLFYKIIFLVGFSLFMVGCAASDTSATNKKTPIEQAEIKLKKSIEQLSSSEPSERAWAAHNIGKHGASAYKAIPKLITALADETTVIMKRYVSRDFSSETTTTTADEAVKTLAKIGAASVKPLVVALKDNNKSVVINSIRALGLLKNSDSIKPLSQFLTHQDKRIRLAAANSLSRFKNPWVADYLLHSLKNKDPAVRSTALYALGKMRNPVALPAIVDLLKDNDSTIRTQALFVLSRFRDDRVIKPLIKLAKSGELNYRLTVINALGNIRDYRVIEFLLTLLDNKNKEVRVAAAESLAQIAEVDFGLNAKKWKHWWANLLKRSG